MDPTHTRSFTLVGHAGDGKTTLADAVLMAAGVTNRLGSVNDGTSYMNFLPEERERRLSISTSVGAFEHAGVASTLLDTPGDVNFAGEAQSSLMAADAALLVLSAQDGVKLGTERAYKAAREAGLALAAVANKMDLERADYDKCATQLETLLGVRVVKLHVPIGAGHDYAGYVDLLTRKACTFAADGSGKLSAKDIPADLANAVEEATMAMVEAVAEADDAVLEKYLETGALEPDEVLATLRKGVREGSLLPLISAASARNIGGTAVLALEESLFPTPVDAVARRATRDKAEILIHANDGPLVAYVFKSIADRYAGMLSVFRVYSGTLHTDMMVINERTGTKERISKLLRLHGETFEDAKEIGPGGIAAIPKLKDTRTGDTLCSDKHVLHVVAPPPPEGVIAFAITAANQDQDDKVFDALHRLVEEDPSLKLERDARTGEFLLKGLGQLHIQITIEKLTRLFGVKVELKPPRVPYLETIRGKAHNVEGKLKKQSGGRGQFGVCYLDVEPGARGSGVQFVDKIVGGSIPRQFIPAVEKGVRETCARGIIAGHEVTDVVISVIDGKYHAVDSSEMAFKTAGSMGLKAAFAQAKPTLLEPIMKMEITVPDVSVGDVMGNLNSRRGRVSGVDARGHMQSVTAHVPMAEVLTYSSDLTSMTGGQGSFHMEFSHYEEVPKEILDKIIAAAGTAKDED